uniref:Protein kinase domain-containing protein n=1 Tax=Oryzias latipes TaxID=8090 RepID=A0A3P9LL16_ORYLA
MNRGPGLRMRKSPGCHGNQVYDIHDVFCCGETGSDLGLHKMMSSEKKEGFILLGRKGVYKVEKFLGEGSYGKVAKCKKLGTDQVVAIKIIWGSGQMEINALEELSQINADDHNLVKFVESFKYKKYTCIAFEVLDQSLLDFMEKRDFHPLTVEEIRTIAWQLIVALKGLKSVNLVHCDIKLDNIMLVDQVSEPFRVKLIDFGLAEKIGHMRTGATMQNICYRAPEVILGLPLDQSVDLWTVGYILFVLYTGSFIHGWDADYNILRAMVKMQGRLVEDNIPFWSCDQLIHSCLDKTKIKEVEQFVDLLKRMLMVDPRKRISPSEALQHPFFTMGRVQPTAGVEASWTPPWGGVPGMFHWTPPRGRSGNAVETASLGWPGPNKS